MHKKQEFSRHADGRESTLTCTHLLVQESCP